MKRYSNRQQLRLFNEIGVTVLLDVMLVVLFVFVLAASLLRPEQLLTVRAAPLQPAGEAVPAASVRLFIFKDSSVMLDGQRLARQNLRSAIIALLAKHPGTGIEVRAHRDLSVQQLADLMTLLTECGVKKTAIATHADDH